MYQLADPTNSKMIYQVKEYLIKNSERKIVSESFKQSHLIFMRDVVEIVTKIGEEYFGEKYALTIKEKTRKKEVVIMRQTAMFVIKKHAPFIPLWSITPETFVTNHSTVLNGVKNIANILETNDKKYSPFVNKCINTIITRWECLSIIKENGSVLKKYL